jgi:hypothetical protein
MIYSIENDFVFLHCPRTSGTALSRSLSVLVGDAVYSDVKKHIVWDELPRSLKKLRSFTISRPLEEVRTSYYRYITKWYRDSLNGAMATRWLIEHAGRMSNMTLDEYLASDEPPVSVDGYSHGCDKVFLFHDKPYHKIAEFCGVDPQKLTALMEVFRG